jgi:hypothetical protein
VLVVVVVKKLGWKGGATLSRAPDEGEERRMRSRLAGVL